MLSEQKILELASAIFPHGKGHLNELMESDAELLETPEKLRLLFTTDEFSAEDLLQDTIPYTLGWNIAVGGISDILATGGTPLFYAHALVVDKKWDESVVSKFCQGVADVLQSCKTTFIGGDVGVSDQWRCTVSVIGELNGEAITRKGASPGDGIFISGKIGGGNLQAAVNLFTGNSAIRRLTDRFQHKFCSRLPESILLKSYATSCIDTSDGVFNALNTVAKMSGTGFNLCELPYQKKGVVLAKLLNLPKALLFLGECGEYELLFTVRPADENTFLQAARQANLTFYRLGTITEGRKTLQENGKIIPLDNLSIRGREYSDPKNYLKDITAHYNHLFENA